MSCASGLIDDPLGRASNRVAAGGAFFEGNFFGICAIAVSLFSNAAATLLVGYKAWCASSTPPRLRSPVLTLTLTLTAATATAT